mmetsp:Transcript_21134/g.58594  ORF Transcript_21134/g.58594 Transcript_21134/m.58594 type:complete len:324 (-) Transcript_21134:609-1580(-)
MRSSAEVQHRPPVWRWADAVHMRRSSQSSAGGILVALALITGVIARILLLGVLAVRAGVLAGVLLFLLEPLAQLEQHHDRPACCSQAHVNDETARVARLALRGHERGQDRRHREGTEGAEAAHPTSGAAQRLGDVDGDQLEDGARADAHADGHDDRGQDVEEGPFGAEHQECPQADDGEGKQQRPLAANAVRERAAQERPGQAAALGVDGGEQARLGVREAVVLHPEGGEPGSQGQVAPVVHEVQGNERPGLDVAGRHLEALHRGALGEHLLAIHLPGDLLRLLGGGALLPQLEVPGVLTKTVVDCGAEDQEAEPQHVGLEHA